MEFTKLCDAGLVLEGGGMRGSYTAGVLDFFIDNNIYFKNCYGVSAGACNCCSYLSKQRGRSYTINVKYANKKEYAGIRSYLRTGNYFNYEYTMNKLPNKILPFDYLEYNRTNANFYAVATDLETGKPEYFKVEDMKKDIRYVWASSSLPLMAKKVEINGKEYLDGGVADSIPVEKAYSDGNEKVVVVLTRDIRYRKKPSTLMPILKLIYRKYPKFVEAMEKRYVNYNRSLKYIKRKEEKGEIFVIRPSKEITVGRLDTDSAKLKALYEQGYQDAMKSYKRMKDYLDL